MSKNEKRNKQNENATLTEMKDNKTERVKRRQIIKCEIKLNTEEGAPCAYWIETPYKENEQSPILRQMGTLYECC